MNRILLVDDEQNVLNALKRELHDDYDIETFNNPFEALQRCHEAQFDLVIADYQMPEMKGIDFLKWFGKLQPNATRIILSGQADSRVLISAINETHIYRFIDKPWDQTELAATIAQALTYRKVLLENIRLKNSKPANINFGYEAQDTQKHYQILVVDDETNILNTISRDLTSRNSFGELHMALMSEADPQNPQKQPDFRFEVYTTTSPIQALEYSKRVACDVVISDYMMPEMNGFEFLKAIREQQPDAACILLTGHTDKKTLTNAINKLEVFNFVSKPWREYELKSAVTQAVIYKNLLIKNRLLATADRPSY